MIAVATVLITAHVVMLFMQCLRKTATKENAALPPSEPPGTGLNISQCPPSSSAAKESDREAMQAEKPMEQPAVVAVSNPEGKSTEQHKHQTQNAEKQPQEGEIKAKESAKANQEQNDPQSGVEIGSGESDKSAAGDPQSSKDNKESSKHTDYFKSSMNPLDEPINEAVWGFSDHPNPEFAVKILEENDDGAIEETAEMLAQKKEEKELPEGFQERKKMSKARDRVTGDKRRSILKSREKPSGRKTAVKLREKNSEEKRLGKSGLKIREKPSGDKRKVQQSGIKSREKSSNYQRNQSAVKPREKASAFADKQSRENAEAFKSKSHMV